MDNTLRSTVLSTDIDGNTTYKNTESTRVDGQELGLRLQEFAPSNAVANAAAHVDYKHGIPQVFAFLNPTPAVAGIENTVAPQPRGSRRDNVVVAPTIH